MSKESQVNQAVGDMIEIAGKTLLSGIPIGGALITSVWDSIKANCVSKRMQEWCTTLEHRLSHLETSLDEIGNNELFTTALYQATESALKTSENQKREYLANAVCNAAKCNLDESVLMMFIDMANRYTLWHIKILHFFDNPMRFESVSSGEYSMGAPMTILLDTFPELRSNEDLAKKIIKDLYTEGLLSTDNVNCTMTWNGMKASRTTKLGRKFIAFLSE